MFVELIATIVAGIACAGLAMILNLAVGRRLPGWIAPVAAGIGMLAMTISNEYTWFARTADSLPEGVEVASTVEEASWLRPWTQVWPYTKRFAAVDRARARTNPKVPMQKMIDVYFFGRWSPVERAPMLVDCAGNRSALLIDGADFDNRGALVNADWRAMPEGDPILARACEE